MVQMATYSTPLFLSYMGILMLSSMVCLFKVATPSAMTVSWGVPGSLMNLIFSRTRSPPLIFMMMG